MLTPEGNSLKDRLIRLMAPTEEEAVYVQGSSVKCLACVLLILLVKH